MACLGLKPGWQDGRRRQIHLAMVHPVVFSIDCFLDILLYSLESRLENLTKMKNVHFKRLLL